ncbi:MAG: hypothetical protein EPN70_18115 [Paraburkholderia sp.]|uniref:hypothetical protein n=1 Tax=Paraburkholderia sp. TaxID=1926495 RepID=UPI00122AF475|nr:hypothetical protein [Paraburkholderia sp.]TAM01974.1 MAG: hypothetical protein EPN70_18115 [Paraburkholderia sp.]
MAKSDLDPFRVILGVIAQRQDSDLLLDVVSATGLCFDESLSEQDGYSHKTRVRALRSRIVSAYGALDESSALSAANAMVAALGPHGEVLREASDALRRVGWDVRDGELVIGEPDLREMFFPKGSQWDAFVVLRGVFAEASTSLTIVDPYCDEKLFPLLSTRADKPLTVRILCWQYASALAAEARAFVAQHPGWKFCVRQAKDFHDRFVIVDHASCVHIGASINGAGKTAFMISRVDDPANQVALLSAIDDSWAAATPV